MNITYLVGFLVSVVIIVAGMQFTADPVTGAFMMKIEQLQNFFDPASVLITIGCSIAIVFASFPFKTFASIPKHFAIMLNVKKNNPMYYINELVELAQLARKNGLLALEEKANEQKDPFFKQAIMLIVDANDPDKVRSILENDIECMSARHEDAAAMYDRGASIAPAFGMIGTLVGLVNMLKNMDAEGGGSSIGADMSVALITTLYGVILAQMIFSPIANNLRTRDEEEVLCKMIIVSGIMSIQSGENPKFLQEKLLTFMEQKQRAGGGKKGKGKGKEAES